MHFKISLSHPANTVIPINYQYPLSAALYRIMAKGDASYAAFLHETGYGKGFKLFSFSQINSSFRLQKDRMQLLNSQMDFTVSFHLPQAMENFIKGLFQSECIEIADKESKASFNILSVETLPNPLQLHQPTEMMQTMMQPLSAVVAGLHNPKGNYDFISPDDPGFADSLIFNWRSKIAGCHDEQIAATALLMLEIIPQKQPFKSRLITIKAGTPAQTKIRGWTNLAIKATAEKRWLELLLNAGIGLYNAMGCGCVQILTT